MGGGSIGVYVKRAQFTYHLLCVMNFFQQRCAQEPTASERQLATLRDTATLGSTRAGVRLVHQGREMPCAVVRGTIPRAIPRSRSRASSGLLRVYRQPRDETTTYSIEHSCNKPPRRATWQLCEGAQACELRDSRSPGAQAWRKYPVSLLAVSFLLQESRMASCAAPVCARPHVARVRGHAR